MGRKHSKEAFLAGALDLALAEGLTQLSFGRVAKHLGVSDRVLVYYFPSKDELISEVLVEVGRRLQETLLATKTPKVKGHAELLRLVWPLLAKPQHDATFRLFFEANGLAVAGVSPYDGVVPLLVEAWVAWTADFFEHRTAAVRSAEAEAAIALLDGLLMLRQICGASAANRAARTMGLMG